MNLPRPLASLFVTLVVAGASAGCVTLLWFWPAQSVVGFFVATIVFTAWGLIHAAMYDS